LLLYKPKIDKLVLPTTVDFVNELASIRKYFDEAASGADERPKREMNGAAGAMTGLPEKIAPRRKYARILVSASITMG
jgi:hypothetical protein